MELIYKYRVLFQYIFANTTSRSKLKLGRANGFLYLLTRPTPFTAAGDLVGMIKVKRQEKLKLLTNQ